MAIFRSYTKPGKGISKEDVEKTGISLYFDILFRRFGKLVSVNLMYLLFSIPAIIISFFIATYLMNAVISFEGIEKTMDLYAVMTVLSVPFTALIFQATGSGPATIAMNTITGKYVRDTNAWIWSDFIDSFKHNFKQGIAMYLINTLVFFACAFAFLFYSYVMGGAMASVLRTFIIVIAMVFFVMQFYTYRIAAEFELKTKHVYRNALLLTFAGLKWNIFAAIVVITMMCLTYTLIAEIFAAGIAILLTIYFVLLTFTQSFITNNIVKKYLLEPSLKMQEEAEKKDTEDDE
ncbi:MAG: DUF624 domain-containing protein [Ruminococcaceae bacterium]|nr:DUF624 domain-containing protein [Oscillospiraceae bacterium]